MITLVADSGSTKTEWVLIRENETRTFQTAGMNPYFASDEDIKAILLDVKDWAAVSVDKVVFYGSGCNSTEKGEDMQQLFSRQFPDAEVEVQSDLVGAAVALFGKQEGIAVILGTGANSGYYNGNEIGFKTESLGYVLGDEGSGAFLGREFIRELLYNNLAAKTETEFYTEFKTNKIEILERIYKKPYPNRYLASFTVFMNEHRDDPAIRKLISGAFELLAINHLEKYPRKHELSFSFVGSIAWHFSDLLKEVCMQHSFNTGIILKKPMDNLVHYYQQNNKG
jgi:glucosamine kinase